MKTPWVLPFLLLLLACSDDNDKSKSKASVADYFNFEDSAVQTAGIRMIPINTPAGNFRVWTKRFGNHPTIKVLLLHGGPAMTHEYLECFESYFPEQGFEFYEYDQLGSYYSDQPTDSSLWTIPRCVEEVEQVRQALGLTKNNFYLLGNSWGGMLAMEYALKYQDNLKGLIVCNMQASIPRYEAYNGKLRAEMPPGFMDSVNMYESKNNYADAVYQEMVMRQFYKKHVCRLEEWPEPVTRSFKHINSSIYTLVQGPSEFKVGGRIINWDRWRDLRNIKVPTLMVGGRYDTMDPNDMRLQADMVQQGRFLYCPNGSHLAMWDDQQTFMEGVIKFIRDVDDGTFKDTSPMLRK